MWGFYARRSSKHCPHRLKLPCERVQDQPKNLQCDYTKQRFISSFSKHHRCVPIALGEPNVALGNLAIDGGAIGEREPHGALRFELQLFPIGLS